MLGVEECEQSGMVGCGLYATQMEPLHLGHERWQRQPLPVAG